MVFAKNVKLKEIKNKVDNSFIKDFKIPVIYTGIFLILGFIVTYKLEKILLKI
jgi:hypothetical protein